jgi:hypothetical protein
MSMSMSLSQLRQALVSPLPAVGEGVRLWRRHGARLRRARMLCACADGLRLRRAAAWQARSGRLYRRCTDTLKGLVPNLDRGGSATVDLDQDAGDARSAHQALALAQRPYRALAAGLLSIGALLAAGALLVVLVGSALSPSLRHRLFPRDLARGRPWTASSGELDAPTSGVGPSSSRRPLFFHTRASDHPWLEIDLGDEHLVRSVLIKNRADCCQERAIPLNVEIFDGRAWRLIAQRRSPFSTWEHDVEPVRARLVRVRLAGFGFLHLKRVSICGQ